MDARQIILQPVVTEKYTVTRELENKYCFRVDPRAGKREIARAIEEIFGVHVVGVRTMNVQGKLRRMGRNIGRRPSWKKAIVALAEGDTIDFFEGV